MPSPLASPVPPEPGTTPSEAPAPQKELPMSSDTVITPPGQATVVGHGNTHDRSFEAALIADAGHQRTSNLLGLEGRFTALADQTHTKALADVEARSQIQIGELKTLILAEADKTRHCVMQQKIDDLRHENTKLSLSVRA